MTSIIDPYFDKTWKITDGPNAGCRFIGACGPRHEGLIIKGCRNMSAITELPAQLKVLVIFGCGALERITYLPPSLKLLCLFDNKNLHELPDLRSSYSLDALAILGCPRLDLGRSPYPPTLKELEFEHSIRRITDDDYERLREQYRADARAAMEALDRGLGAYLEKAEAAATALLETKSEESLMKSEEVSSASRDGARERETVEATAEKPAGGDEAPTARQSERVCAKCETQNDADAAFCKRCGTKLEAA